MNASAIKTLVEAGKNVTALKSILSQSLDYDVWLNFQIDPRMILVDACRELLVSRDLACVDELIPKIKNPALLCQVDPEKMTWPDVMGWKGCLGWRTRIAIAHLECTRQLLLQSSSAKRKKPLRKLDHHKVIQVTEQTFLPYGLVYDIASALVEPDPLGTHQILAVPGDKSVSISAALVRRHGDTAVAELVSLRFDAFVRKVNTTLDFYIHPDIAYVSRDDDFKDAENSAWSWARSGAMEFGNTVDVRWHLKRGKNQRIDLPLIGNSVGAAMGAGLMLLGRTLTISQIGHFQGVCFAAAIQNQGKLYRVGHLREKLIAARSSVPKTVVMLISADQEKSTEWKALNLKRIQTATRKSPWSIWKDPNDPVHLLSVAKISDAPAAIAAFFKWSNPFSGCPAVLSTPASSPNESHAAKPLFNEFSAGAASLRSEEIGIPVVSLPEIIETLANSGHEGGQVALISHFPTDSGALLERSLCDRTLISRVGSGIFGSVYRVDGRDILSVPSGAVSQLLRSSETGWANLPRPSLCLVDLSLVGISSIKDHMLPNRLSQEEVDRFRNLFSIWQRLNHKVIVFLSRLVTMMVNLDNIFHGFKNVYIAEPLYFTRKNLGLETPFDSNGAAAQATARGQFNNPFAGVASVFHANSATLVDALEKYLEQLNIPPGTSLELQTPGSLEKYGELARFLMEQGFLEIAFRIEVYCQTAHVVRSFVELEVDFMTFASRVAKPGDSIQGLLDTVRDIPLLTDRAILTGGAGSGKSSTLQCLAHDMALAKTRGSNWVPLLVNAMFGGPISLDSAVPGSLAETADFSPNDHARLLPCHRLLATAKTFRSVASCFSSPLYLLVDDFDADTDHAEAHIAESRQLTGTGLLVASRSNKQYDGFTTITLRELNNQQFRDFLKRRGAPLSWYNLLGIVDAPIATYLRNPFLLEIICELRPSERELKHATLYSLLERFIAELFPQSRHPEDEIPSPHEALEHLAHAWCVNPETQSIEDSILKSVKNSRAAILVGIKHGKTLPRFHHSLFQDYHAAGFLVRICQTDTVATMLANGLLSGDGLKRRRTDAVLQILAARLDPINRAILLRHLANNDQMLALKCLLGFPAREGTWQETADQLVAAIIGKAERMTLKYEHALERHKLFQFLGFLDTRIEANSVPDQMIRIATGRFEFRVSRFPVTNLEYFKYTQSTLAPPPPYSTQLAFNRPNYPVVGITFAEAVSYCEWLTKRNPGFVFFLPSAEEWNWSLCGAGDASVILYRLQDSNLSEEARLRLLDDLRSACTHLLEGHLDQLRYGRYTPVGMFNPTPTGCFDMIGNVWQWCNSFPKAQSSLSPEGQQVSGHAFLVKGGRRVYDDSHDAVWMLEDGAFSPRTQYHDIGFRVCCRAETNQITKNEKSV